MRGQWVGGGGGGGVREVGRGRLSGGEKEREVTEKGFFYGISILDVD